MTKRSIFAKIFLITFALFSGLVILLHASVYFIFPSTYIESQRQTILKKSQALAKSFQGQEEGTIESVIDLYSKTNDIKVSIKSKEKQNALEVKDDLLVNPNSQNNHPVKRNLLCLLPDGIEDLRAGPGLAFMLEQVFQDFQLLGIHGDGLPS